MQGERKSGDSGRRYALPRRGWGVLICSEQGWGYDGGMKMVGIVLVMVMGAVSARGWSNKEHIQLTRLAVGRLLADPTTPGEMKAWLRAACPGVLTLEQEKEYFMKQRVGLIPRGVEGILYWAVVPDMNALLASAEQKKIKPFNVPERMLHYVDLEYFVREEPKRRYAHDLSNKPFLFDISNSLHDDTWKRAGMLPFRVEQCYNLLVEAIRSGRLVDEPGKFPRDEHATKWAGYLAHYLQDNTQPQHATEDYRARSYFADKRNAPNVHWDVEGRLCDDEEADYPELRGEFWRLFAKALEEFKDPVEIEDDVWAATMDVSARSYDALPLIGLAAMKAYGQQGTPQNPQGAIGKFDAEAFFRFKGKVGEEEMTLMAMKARQMAWSVKRVERVLKKAWGEAQKPAKARVGEEGIQ